MPRECCKPYPSGRMTNDERQHKSNISQLRFQFILKMWILCTWSDSTIITNCDTCGVYSLDPFLTLLPLFSSWNNKELSHFFSIAMKILLGGSWRLLYPSLKYARMFPCLFNETTVYCQWRWFQSLQEVHVLLWTMQLAKFFITLLTTVKLYEKTHFFGNLHGSWTGIVLNSEMNCSMTTKECWRSTSTTLEQSRCFAHWNLYGHCCWCSVSILIFKCMWNIIHFGDYT